MEKNAVRKKRVLVAMSGGVDSSVAAALLKKAGFDVSGAFVRCWRAEKGDCCQAEEDQYIARLAAAKIGIPFYSFDFTKEYKKKVVDYFIREYARGSTPNPDIMCNREIKFGVLLEKALRLGFDFLATGHYAKIEDGQGLPRLLAGSDSNKDQSYFLYKIKPEILNRIIFPIGSYTKPRVRAMARAFGLPNAQRKDSQGICFIGEVKLVDFLKRYLPSKAGNIISKDGKLLGKHPGIQYYTIGQRKGLNLPGGPYYIMEKNPENNTLIVTGNKKDLEKRRILVSDVNWLLPEELRLPLRIKAKIRYRQKMAWAKLSKWKFTKHKQYYRVAFEKPQYAIAPGQSVVFYLPQKKKKTKGKAKQEFWVLGGGEIMR